MNFMMGSDNKNHEDEMPEAKTPGEVNVHLGYIRRDIRNLQEQTTNAFKSIESKIDNLDDHYITEAEFRPIANLAERNATQIKLLTEWRDTFNGKMIGFGAAISIVSAILSFAFNHFFK